MRHLKQRISRPYLNITAVLLTIPFAQQSVWADSIYSFWQANRSSNQIFYSASYDGMNWFSYDDQTFSQTINSAEITTAAPASAAFKDELYVVWRSNTDNIIFYSASSDGSAWTPQLPINKYNITPTSPAASVYNGSVYIAWKDPDSHSIYYTASSDGKTWPDGQPIARVATNGSTAAAPALAGPFSPDLSYNFYCSAIDNSGIGWSTAKCCDPSTENCGNNGSQNFSTGHDNKDPYSGSLDPKQKLKLTIVCSHDRKVETSTHDFKHNNSINCSHSQQDKGTKIYYCQNYSNDSVHTWHLKGYKCHGN